jgi:hypothetical protein
LDKAGASSRCCLKFRLWHRRHKFLAWFR